MKPFDFIKDASYTKKNLMEGTENDSFAESQYNAWLTNQAFSLHPDTILIANEVNQRHHLPNKGQYLIYINMLRPRKRFKKWPKETSNELLDVVCDAYQCNMNVARQYLELLDDEQINELREKQEKGELKK